MPIEIRCYREVDRRAVIALWNEALPPSAPHHEPNAAIDNKLEVDPDLFLVAADEEQVVGTVMGGYDGHRGWVYSVAVRPSHRGRGIGGQLLRHLELALKDRGCLKINLQVREANAGVIRFYEKQGYAVEELISMGKRLYS